MRILTCLNGNYMKKWEYEIQLFDFSTGSWPLTTDKTLYPVLKSMGEKGWELVQIIQEGPFYYFFFKRELLNQ